MTRAAVARALSAGGGGAAHNALAPTHAASAARRCAHCDTAVEASAEADGGGEAAIYCCLGCELAAAMIREAGLDAYYSTRTAPAPRPTWLGADAAAGSVRDAIRAPVFEDKKVAWGTIPVEIRGDGRVQASLSIEGLTCAACVWVTERVLGRTPGVEEATVSHATGRAFLVWDPARTDLPKLAARIERLGYRARPQTDAGRVDRGLLLRLGLSAFLAMNVMLLSATLYTAWWDGMSIGYTTLFRWTSLVLATPVALWCAEPFFTGAWQGLRVRIPHMDLPISIGILVMYGHGVYATRVGEDTWLDSMTMLVTALLAGRLIEQRGRRRAVEAALALSAASPANARVVRGQRVDTVPAADLLPGELIEVGAGEELAADGVIVEGHALVRNALVTGESEPVAVGPGARVVAGAVFVDGGVQLRVEAAGASTLVQRMAASLADAASQPLAPDLIHKLVPGFTVGTILLALVGGVLTAWAEGQAAGVGVAVAVLVVTCPCALALASPLSVAAGLGAAARRGLLIRSGEGLRAFGGVTMVVLDKTGTVTHGVPKVVAASDPLLRIAAGLERRSSHPIARAVVAEAVRRGIPLPEARGVKEVPGIGISGEVDGKIWALRRGSPGTIGLWAEHGPVGELRLTDTLRQDASATVAALLRRGLRVVLLSGDHVEVVARIAVEAGVPERVAAAGPEAKAAWIREQQAMGHRVLFVGDGINDGLALAAADLGVAMGGGAASSVLVADAVVAREGLAPILAGLDAAQACATTTRRNVARSLLYNAVAVAVALAGWMNPLVAAILRPLSSALVVVGASRVEAAVARPG